MRRGEVQASRRQRRLHRLPAELVPRADGADRGLRLPVQRRYACWCCVCVCVRALPACLAVLCPALSRGNLDLPISDAPGMRGHTRRRARLDALVLLLGLLLGLAHVARPQCPNNAQMPGGATQWTSCACNAGYTDTSGLINLARACSAGGCPVTVNANLDPNTFPNSRITDGVSWIHHTVNANPWTMIDFEQTVFVSMVRIFNRVDCCSELLVNFELRVGDSSTFSNNPACALNQPSFTDTKDFPCILSGRYFSINQPGGNLHLREIEVYGSKASEVCTACFAGTFKSTAGSAACADCAAGKYQAAAVATTNPPEAARTYSGNCGGDAIGTGHARSMLDSAGAWSAADGSGCTPAAGQWMQIDMGSNFRVHGVVTQCRPCCHQCVTEMEVHYSLTTSDFVSARTAGGSTRFSLPTTFDSNVKTSSIFSQPVTARYIKIFVYAWVDYASIRAAVLTLSTTISDACADCGAGKYSAATGATTASVCVDCTAGKYSATSDSTCVNCAAGKYQDAVVITTNPPEASRTYESVWGNSAPGTDFARSMLDSAQAWSWGGALPEWMQIDLGSEFRVHGVVTQCRANFEQCPHEIEVQHSLTASNFVSATAVGGTTRFFPPTTYSSTVKTLSNFSQPVVARYIRIVVHAGSSFRAGVLTSLASAAWNACADCGAGKYSAATGATAASTCQSCPSSSQSATGSDAATDCVCVAGFTGLDGGTCSACGAGKYKTTAGSVACTDCPLNSHHALTQQTAASACQCNAGTRCVC